MRKINKTTGAWIDRRAASCRNGVRQWVVLPTLGSILDIHSSRGYGAILAGLQGNKSRLLGGKASCSVAGHERAARLTPLRGIPNVGTPGAIYNAHAPAGERWSVLTLRLPAAQRQGSVQRRWEETHRHCGRRTNRHANVAAVERRGRRPATPLSLESVARSANPGAMALVIRAQGFASGGSHVVDLLSYCSTGCTRPPAGAHSLGRACDHLVLEDEGGRAEATPAAMTRNHARTPRGETSSRDTTCKGKRGSSDDSAGSSPASLPHNGPDYLAWGGEDYSGNDLQKYSRRRGGSPL